MHGAHRTVRRADTAEDSGRGHCRAAFPDVEVVILTTFEQDDYISARYAAMPPTIVLLGLAFSLAYAALTIPPTDGVAEDEQGSRGDCLTSRCSSGSAGPRDRARGLRRRDRRRRVRGDAGGRLSNGAHRPRGRYRRRRDDHAVGAWGPAPPRGGTRCRGCAAAPAVESQAAVEARASVEALGSGHLLGRRRGRDRRRRASHAAEDGVRRPLSVRRRPISLTARPRRPRRRCEDRVRHHRRVREGLPGKRGSRRRRWRARRSGTR